MSLKYQIAEALEKTAAFLDAQENEKVAAAQAQRTQIVDSFAEKFANATGDALESHVREKLIHSDVDLMSAFEKMASVLGHRDESPDELGGPGNYSDTPPAPTTTKEAAARAGDTFVNWIMND